MHLHYCNTWFEETLLAPKQTLRHPHYLFQYLPILYAPEGSTLLVDAFPPTPIPDYTICPFDPTLGPLELWVQQDPLTVKLLSKEFLFYHSNRPKGSRIITNKEEALAYERAFANRCVFKQFISFSGMGHARKAEDIVRYPCLAEPWFDRTLDFSTQWIVHDSGLEYLGETHLLVASGGGYRGTEIGCITINKRILDAHIGEAKELLETIRQMGFRGNVGLDSFVHTEGSRPICEMNPRKTMGYVALMYAKKKGFKQMRLKIGPSPSDPLLPNCLIDTYNQQLRFPKNLFLDKL